MAQSSRSAARRRPSAAAPARPKLRAVTGLDTILSGKVAPRKRKKRRGAEKKPEALPPELGSYGDILAAGRKVQRETDFKLRFAEERIREYCLRRFCEKFAALGRRPDSISYAGPHSHFTFIQTQRIGITPEKVDALRSLGVPMDQYTELKGLRVNFEAIREHRLEEKLRDALSEMGLNNQVLDEVFEPQVALKENFFDSLDLIVSKTLARDEKLEDKLYEVTRILGPASQIRNAETPDLNSQEAFQLILKAEISPEEDDQEELDEL